MKPLFLVTFWFTLCYGYSLWPQPQEVVTEKTFLMIKPPAFHEEVIKANKSEACSVVAKAVTRLRSAMFEQSCSRLASWDSANLHPGNHDFDLDPDFDGQIEKLTVHVEGKCDEVPRMNMDESYTITVDRNGVVIRAPETWGAIRGLHTFSQMVNHTGHYEFTVNVGKIVDYPRFSHRGLLLDTSRHFLSMRSILATLDAMELNKMNVLHWHIVDDLSFPFVSTTFPELSNKGSFRALTHVYKPEDVSKIIEYARLRGIRVVVEFDTPGHTLSWGKGQPDLLTKCYSNGKPNGNFGPIDPTKDSTYEFVQKLFYEILHVFPDQFIHLGGDEVDFECWKSNPDIQKFMNESKLTGYAQLEGVYIQKLVDIVANLNKSYIVWQEVFDNGVKIKEDTIVHVWKGGDAWASEMEKVTKAGHHTLLSSCWYLDNIRYGSDWKPFYQCDPTDFNGDEQQKSRVLGGEAFMWGEWVDSSNLISRTWPRASAVAERLWSSEKLQDPNKAEARFHDQQCRMQKLGIRAEPIEGPGTFCDCDHE